LLSRYLFWTRAVDRQRPTTPMVNAPPDLLRAFCSWAMAKRTARTIMRRKLKIKMTVMQEEQAWGVWRSEGTHFPSTQER